MAQFVEGCGDGRSNPLLNYVHQYTDDKSGWQDQFLEDDRREPYFGPGPMQFGPPPMHPAMLEKKMVDEFLNPHEFERFDQFGPREPFPVVPQEFTHASRLPPQLFNDFVHSFHDNEVISTDSLPNVQLAPQDASKIRNRSQIMSRHFNPDAEFAEGQQLDSLLHNLNINREGKDEMNPQSIWQDSAVAKRHGAWIRDYDAATNEEEKEFESAWRSREHPSEGQRWAQEYPQEEFEEVYSKISERNEAKEWAQSFIKEDEGNNNWKDCAYQASQIDDPKLQNSQFMQFVNKMASGELTLQNGQLVPVTEGQRMASEFLSQGENWADQFTSGRNWADQFDGKNWADQFESGTNWADQFQGDWEEQDLMNQYKDVWDKIQEREKDKKYTFQEENKYMNDPDALQKGIAFFEKGNLPEAIQALEAAVQQNPDNTEAWSKLGMAHAENDKDSLAILALDQALVVDPNNLEALLALAVSHTNEFHQSNAVQALNQWLLRNPKYKDLFPSDPEEFVDLRKVEHKFIAAAQSQSAIDPTVHSALGLIYNLSFEYDKAIDCFRAALTEKPDDYQLWNKLGATTANSTHGKERAHEAIDAYFRALQRKPTYTRARANLGISYMATQNYTEAAKCFLGAIDINNTPHLWDNLRSAFTMMERPDMIERINARNVNLFRDEFDF